MYVEFFTPLQAREVLERVAEGLRVQMGYDPHLGNALCVRVPPTAHRGAMHTVVRVAMAGEEPRVLDPLRDRHLSTAPLARWECNHVAGAYPGPWLLPLGALAVLM